MIAIGRRVQTKQYLHFSLFSIIGFVLFHLRLQLRFGELPIKRAVPLALALCYVSNPQLKVLDTLSKFSHDSDNELSYNSILALGIVGAGKPSACFVFERFSGLSNEWNSGKDW